MNFLLYGVVGASGPQVSGAAGQIVAVTGAMPGTAGAGITYANAPLGSPTSNRIIYVVCTFFDGASTEGHPSSVTVGGNAATLLAHVYKPSDNTCGISIWAYRDNGALGANADVVAEHATARNSRSVAVVAGAAGAGNVIDIVGDANLTGSVTPDTLITDGANCLLYVSMFQNGYDPTAPAPFTDGQYTFDENTAEWVCIGWTNEPSGDPESVTIPTGGSPAPLRAAYLAVALD